ncbi:hypothetical protein EFA46_015440 (plasmid) [Halarchaeum sp. CBA1220]|uniref:hypothetical protein n=1 Tax=Halarchaeum sp. CBA1220 TaxID=1853682 RepID=UPI000F3AA21D|nr:hypothetical protein [Halarchaeum sp. CBA1220]QLC35652.1 hypothetical protein EFA46_015440 [Halarchaeum sp. CBA1220]
MSNWKMLSTAVLNGAEYTNAKKGWRREDTGEEVIIYRVEGTGMEELTEKEWAVQHPEDENGEHTHFFNEFGNAEDFAERFVH